MAVATNEDIYERRKNLFALRNIGGAFALQKYIGKHASDLETVLKTHKHKLYDTFFEKESCNCNPNCKRNNSSSQFCWGILFHKIDDGDVCKLPANINCICVYDPKAGLTLQHLDFTCLSHIALLVAGGTTQRAIKMLKKMRNRISHPQIGEDPNIDKDEEIIKTKEVIKEIVSTCDEIDQTDTLTFLELLLNNPRNGNNQNRLSSLKNVSKETQQKIEMLVNYPEQYKQVQELSLILQWPVEVRERNSDIVESLLTRATWIDPDKIIQNCPDIRIDEDLSLLDKTEKLTKIFAVVDRECASSIERYLEQQIFQIFQGGNRPVQLQSTDSDSAVISQCISISIECNSLSEPGDILATITLEKEFPDKTLAIEKIKNVNLTKVLKENGLTLKSITEGSIVLQFVIHDPIDAILLEERVHTGSIRALVRQLYSEADLMGNEPCQIHVQITHSDTTPTKVNKEELTILEFLADESELLLREIDAENLSKFLQDEHLNRVVEGAIFERPFDRKFHASVVLRSVKEKIKKDPKQENIFLLALGKTQHFFILNQMNTYKEKRIEKEITEKGSMEQRLRKENSDLQIQLKSMEEMIEKEKTEKESMVLLAKELVPSELLERARSYLQLFRVVFLDIHIKWFMLSSMRNRVTGILVNILRKYNQGDFIFPQTNRDDESRFFRAVVEFCHQLPWEQFESDGEQDYINTEFKIMQEICKFKGKGYRSHRKTGEDISSEMIGQAIECLDDDDILLQATIRRYLYELRSHDYHRHGDDQQSLMIALKIYNKHSELIGPQTKSEFVGPQKKSYRPGNQHQWSELQRELNELPAKSSHDEWDYILTVYELTEELFEFKRKVGQLPPEAVKKLLADDVFYEQYLKRKSDQKPELIKKKIKSASGMPISKVDTSKLVHPKETSHSSSDVSKTVGKGEEK